VEPRREWSEARRNLSKPVFLKPYWPIIVKATKHMSFSQFCRARVHLQDWWSWVYFA
jgi:hypothetical protein